MNLPQFIIAAPNSNAGKTTVTLVLLQALKKKGYRVQPFKCGPDYIDPKFHETISGRPSINLDLYMMGPEEVKSSYAAYAEGAEVCLVEGVMGLFDGARKMEGSTAALAKQLNIPVVLVVDASAVAYSIAPILYGFKHFDKNIALAGVIFNKVKTKSHYQFLKEAAQDVGITPFGYVRPHEAPPMHSRHLGLDLKERQRLKEYIPKIAEDLEQTLDLEALLRSVEIAVPKQKVQNSNPNKNLKRVIAVAQDAAFNFVYVQNISALKSQGTLVYFSPLEDASLPKADFVYLPGGYPELYAEKLAQNTSMKQSILSYANKGGEILAECGGMMYLGKHLMDSKGASHPMVGFFDWSTSMEAMQLQLGYRSLELPGLKLKGHEFHYSKLIDVAKVNGKWKVGNARGAQVQSPVFKEKGVFASYLHLYFGSPQLCSDLIKQLHKT